MTTWEYKVEYMSAPTMRGTEASALWLVERLNDLGVDGWELVKAPGVEGQFFFKRPKP